MQQINEPKRIFEIEMINDHISFTEWRFKLKNFCYGDYDGDPVDPESAQCIIF